MAQIYADSLWSAVLPRRNFVPVSSHSKSALAKLRTQSVQFELNETEADLEWQGVFCVKSLRLGAGRAGERA